MDFQDFNEITRRRYEYAQGIDTRDFALLRSIFTDEVTMDFEDYGGPPVQTLKADDWVRAVETLISGLDATQHVMTNPIVDVDVDADTAVCRMYMKAEHFLKNDQGNFDFAIGGYYVDRLKRIDGRWLITAVTLKLFWSRGNRHIMTLAAERGAKRLGA